MYLDFYGLKDTPFSITPDPRFVYLSERHRDALAHLLYGIGQGGSGGFVQLTGEVGTGKTTLCRLLLEQLPEKTRVALVLNPRLSPVELLETICEELKLSIDGKRGSIKGLVDTLNEYLLEAYAQGLRVVVIIDEAQNLSIEALEQVRLLTNLETATQKLLQIILLGQPELREMLARTELRQLAQRITARYHLMPLSAEESEAYVHHRLAVAGSPRSPFTRLALRAIHRRSGGVPRLINVVAERALIAGFAQDQNPIGERLLEQAADEALAHPMRRRWPWLIGAAAALLLVGGVAGWFWSQRVDPPPAEVVSEEIEEPLVAAPDEFAGEAELLEQLTGPSGSDINAWTSLLSMWRVNAERVSVRDAVRCPAQITPGLLCLRSSGSLGRIASNNRPVILRMPVGGQDYFAVLVSLGDDHAVLDLAGRRLRIALATLERFWRGEYTSIWRMPEYLPVTIKRGDHGLPVTWLVDKLDGVEGEVSELPLGPPWFDEQLETRVRRLQQLHGIGADGVVGPETFIAIASYESSGPRLSRRARPPLSLP